jgi:hypothetical protein
LLRFVSADALPLPALLRLVDHSSDAHWHPLTPSLLDLAQWLLLTPLTATRAKLALGDTSLLEASAWAARLLRRLFELHAPHRDAILGFLLSLCINGALHRAYGR